MRLPLTPPDFTFDVDLSVLGRIFDSLSFVDPLIDLYDDGREFSLAARYAAKGAVLRALTEGLFRASDDVFDDGPSVRKVTIPGYGILVFSEALVVAIEAEDLSPLDAVYLTEIIEASGRYVGAFRNLVSSTENR